ncbi:threonylcarbamoyl-AMP synthase, partial [Candidatus Bathyarchaeota archaeon]|nr:threonylcarbamoyl-AMP synthase [Candidatus Bathyarchaeota archaeon]NIW34695.1 threonylcarbamoyl-AMP synthase [Candidatus Bathyarchaeota archaeon]
MVLISMSSTHLWMKMRFLAATEENIRVASQVVRRGGVVVYPTDTVYGLGCNSFNLDAVKRVIRVKGEREKPLPILASSMTDVEKIADISDLARRLAAEFWPGPLTIIVPKLPSLSDIVTHGLDSVGVRMPDHEVAIQLIRLSEGLLVGTSANKTGHNPACTAQEAWEQLGEETDVVLDGGPAPLKRPSTVIDLREERLRILREGPLT